MRLIRPVIIAALAAGIMGSLATVVSPAAAFPPFNDNVDGPATTIFSIPSTSAQTTAEATTQLGEPLPCGNMGATVWFKIFAPSGVNYYTADTYGSDFDTVLAVYRATSDSVTQFSELTLVGCNDNLVGLQSAVPFTTAASNNYYYFQAGGALGATGNLVIHLLPDTDGDQIGGAVDNCPSTANGPAQAAVLGVGNQTDSDGDGVPGTQPPSGAIFGGDACDIDDDNDAFPDVNENPGCRTRPEDYDDFADTDGCPDSDNDLDGVCDTGQTSVACTGSDVGKYCFDPAGTLPCHVAATSDCRNVAEDLDAFKDTDGCPEPDNDNDGFPDGTDACPGTDSQAGTDGMLGSPQDLNHNGVKDGAEATLTTDDVLTYAFEDRDGVLDTDGCHDSPGEDFDGDGFSDDDEALRIGTNAGYPCGVAGWPSNLVDPAPPFPANTVDIFDVTSFLAPARRLDTDLAAYGDNSRWDLAPGPGVFGTDVNIADLTALFNGAAGSGAFPPMFNGGRAWERVCPLPP
jgi:hypothetical protein